MKYAQQISAGLVVLLGIGCGTELAKREPVDSPRQDSAAWCDPGTGAGTDSVYELPVLPETGFVKSFEGSIGGKYEIILTLIDRGAIYGGTYTYKSQNIPLRLDGTDSRSGFIFLREFNAENVQTGLFELKFEGEKLKGTWENTLTGKKFDCVLQQTEKPQANYYFSTYKTGDKTSGRYPQIRFPGHERQALKINARMEEYVKERPDCFFEFEQERFGNFLQIRPIYDCVRAKFTYSEYLLFNLETGEQVEDDDLFDPGMKKLFLEILGKRIRYEYQIMREDCKDIVIIQEELNWEDIDVHIRPTGISFYYDYQFCEACKPCEGEGTFELSWAQVAKYLR